MEFNRNNFDSFKEMVNEIKAFKERENLEKLNYLYPNASRLTHQIRWFKGSRDRGFKSDKAA